MKEGEGERERETGRQIRRNKSLFFILNGKGELELLFLSDQKSLNVSIKNETMVPTYKKTGLFTERV